MDKPLFRFLVDTEDQLEISDWCHDALEPSTWYWAGLVTTVGESFEFKFGYWWNTNIPEVALQFKLVHGHKYRSGAFIDLGDKVKFFDDRTGPRRFRTGVVISISGTVYRVHAKSQIIKNREYASQTFLLNASSLEKVVP